MLSLQLQPNVRLSQRNSGYFRPRILNYKSNLHKYYS